MASPASTVREHKHIIPTRAEAHRLFEQGDLLPVYRSVLADLDTPVSIYLKLRAAGMAAFLLESVEGGEQVGRYSFLGVNPRARLVVEGRTVTRIEGGVAQRLELAPGEDPLDAIRRELQQVTCIRVDGLPRFIGGAVGYLGYDVVRFFERLPATAPRDLDVPDAIFLLVDTLVIFDHPRQRLLILANARLNGDPDAAYDDALRRIDAVAGALDAPLPPIPQAGAPTGAVMTSNMPRERYEAGVRQAKEHIAAGDVFQVVLSQRFSRRTSAPPLLIYRALRALNPSPYMFFFEFGEHGGQPLSLIGASPEMLVRLEDGLATVRPIAGTRPRGESEAADEKLAADLLADPKERAEHVMLVDLGRNDLGRVCEYGTVRVPHMMDVERYSHVMHIVSQVEGRVRPGLDAFDVIRATFPAGTLSGAPKIRAMEIIEALEGTRRGPYGGAVGYFGYDGSMDTCITIRAMVVHGDTVHVQAGAGIVADSDPAREYEETAHKARALAVAVQQAEEGLM